MRNTIFFSVGMFFILIVSSYSTCDQQKTSENRTKVFLRTDTTAVVEPNDTILIRLAYKPGTAFFWHSPHQEDTALVQFIQQKNIELAPDDTLQQIVGGNAIDEFKYLAKKVGKTNLAFYHKAVFENFQQANDSVFIKLNIIAKPIQ